MMRSSTLVLAAGAVAAPATAATISITLPQPAVAEYHRPYVAAWIEPAAGGPARTLAVWYDIKRQGREPGTKWLTELRTWWRRGGRSLALPADGVSGATRPAGPQQIALPANLPAGAYVLNVEAAREKGGRELVSLPISVPAKPASTSGKTELGAVTLR